MLSVIIPSFKDPFLIKTIESVLANAKGAVEVIPVIDGYNEPQLDSLDKRVKPIVFYQNLGMRSAINAGVNAARGKFIMKVDSHCAFAPNFDKILVKYCEENQLVIPRRYSLDEGKFGRNLNRPYRDYHLIMYPRYLHGYGVCMTNQDWLRYGGVRSDPKYDIDDTMTFQGSCWMAHRKHFISRVGLLDDRPEAYGPFGGEQLEIGLKYWLSGDEVKVNKKTWYAHLSKQPRHYREGVYLRGYKNNQVRGRTWATKHWMNNEEPKMKYKFSWLVEKFWPVPTWPDDRNLWVYPPPK